MKKEWEELPLAELCSVLSGLWKGKTKPFQTATVIRNTNFTKDCRLDLEDVAVLEVEVRQLVKRRLLPGDLVLEKSGGGPKQPVGRVVYFDQADGVYSFSNFTSVLRVKDSAVISPAYLQRYLYWQYVAGITEKMQRRSTGIRNLDMAAYMAIPVRYPSLAEQRRIVAILDEAFEGITAAKANEEKNLQSAREVFEAQRECLLSGGEHGWAEKPVGELCEIKHGFAFQSKYFANDGDYICLTPGNFFEDGGYRDRGDKTKYYSGPVPAGFVLSAGQMLVAMTEQAPGLLGSPAIVPAGQQFLHNQRLGLICPKEGTPWVNDFFFHVFNRPAFRRAVHRSATGVKVRHTSPSKLGLIGVSFPASEGDQRKVAAAINAIQQEVDSHQEIIHRKTTALDELKGSLLHQAFTGQL